MSSQWDNCCIKCLTCVKFFPFKGKSVHKIGVGLSKLKLHLAAKMYWFKPKVLLAATILQIVNDVLLRFII